MVKIHPLQPIAVIVLTGIFLYTRWKKKQGGKPAAPPPFGSWEGRAKPAVTKPKETPEEAFMRLRRRAFETTAVNLGLDPKGTEPYGLVMEMGIQISVVTLVSFADGDASVYYKTGGGMVGGISHESVRSVAKAFVGLAPKALPKMIRTTEFPLPGPDRVRFYILTPQGVFTTETNRQNLTNPKSELGALFYSGQEVVAQMRQVQEQKQEERKELRAKVPGYVTEEPEPAPPPARP